MKTYLLTLNTAKSLVATLLIVSGFSASAQIYVASYNGYVGEYTTSGATVNSALITGLAIPWEMTSDGNDLYLANEGNHSVGKYTTAGTTVNSALISVPGYPEGVALDGNGYVYVVDALSGTVGKYTTSGATVDASLITGLPTDGFASIACDGDGHLFLANSGYGSNSIKEYTTSGTLVNAALISLKDVYTLTCDENGNLFTTSDGFVGEYTTSGATVNASLISGLDSREFGIALDGNGHIFVSNHVEGTIGEYTTTGATVNAALVTGLSSPMGLVVVPEPSFLALMWFGTTLLIRLRKSQAVQQIA